MNSKRSKLALTLRRLLNPALLAAFVAPGIALAGPTGDDVVRGSATIERPDSNSTVINQQSDRAVVNWQSFSVAGQEYVLFNQPSASSVILNRVIGSDASTILGTVQSNGRVFLVNPNGIFFGESATLNVNGLVASTLDIDNDDFMDGRYVLRRGENAADGTVQNAGTLTTADGGFVVLAGDYVENTGVIAARLGHVVMASGAEVTLDLDGTGLIGFAVDDATLAELAGVRNAGEIIAAGGMVIMTAEVARDLLSTVVNNEGLIAAHSVEDRSGVIYLHGVGGDVEHSGALIADGLGDGESGGDIRLIASGTLTLDADATISAQGSERGGFVEVSGHQNLNMGGDITVGNGGTLLIDPTTLTIVPGVGAPSTFTNSEVGVGFIEGQLNANTNVRLIATQLITADPGVTAITALGGTGSLWMDIGVPSGASAGNCGDFGFCAAGDTAFSIITGGSGGDVQLGNVDIHILGNFRSYGDPDWTLSGDFAIGNVIAAQITIDVNGPITAGNLTATNLNIDLVAGSVDQQVNILTGDLTAANDSVGVYLWTENPSPGTDSINVGNVFALDEIYIASDSDYLRNFNFMVASADAEYVYLNPELYGGGTLMASVGNVTAVYSEIDARVYGPSGGGTLTISGTVNVSDELYIWTFGDQPMDLSIANHIGGANVIEIESNGNLDALNVTAVFEADISATGDVVVGDVFAEFGIWLGSSNGSVTAANITLTNVDPGEESSLYLSAETGIDVGGITANSAGGAGIEINNNTSGDISILGGITSQSTVFDGSISLFQWGAGNIFVGGIIRTNDLQIFHDVDGFQTNLAGLDLFPAPIGAPPYMNLSLYGELILGFVSFVDTDPGAGADLYIYADTLTVNDQISVVGDGDVFLTLDAIDLVVGGGASTNLISTSGGATHVTLYGESMVINGIVTAQTIITEIWDATYSGTTGASYAISGTGSLNAVNPGGIASLHFGIWPDSDITSPQVALGLGNIVIDGETTQLTYEFNTGTINSFNLTGGLTVSQSSTVDPLLMELALTAGYVNISADQSLDLSNSMIESTGLVQLTSNAGNIHVSGASIEAGRLIMQAAGDILNTGPANLSANAMLLESAGNIDLGDSTLIIGDGMISGLVGDPDAIAVLTDFDLADTSTVPNGALRAGGAVHIGTLAFNGDYLVFQGSAFTLDSFTGPTFQYLVQVAPISPTSDMVLTGPVAGTVTASWDYFLSQFTGATYILGASNFEAIIDTGRSTVLDMGTANVLFASTIDPPLLGEVITSGIILTMDGRVGTVEERPFRPPTTAEILGTDFRGDAGVRTVTRFGQANTGSNDDPDRDDTIRHGSDDDLVCE